MRFGPATPGFVVFDICMQFKRNERSFVVRSMYMLRKMCEQMDLTPVVLETERVDAIQCHRRAIRTDAQVGG